MVSPLGPQPVEPIALPALREELQLLPAAASQDGEPNWTLFDPMRNRYFRIGWGPFQLLSRWQVGEAQSLLAAVRSETTFQATDDDLAELVQFLYSNSLTLASASGGVEDYVARAKAAKPPWAQWLIHHYLFFKIPLIRPDRFLDATLPWIRPILRRETLFFVGALGLLGLYLVGRQWGEFWSTFQFFFSWHGLALYGLAQAVTKILHELGHAYVAKHYGCRVPTMGVAFMVLFPVLYTDTTDAWKLRSRSQRMAIGGAGIAVEIALAAFATLAWTLLPDGSLRSVAFAIATTNWILTLAVNLNPCMRFDGYYLLSDLLKVENLQERSFAWGRWHLRETLFAFGDETPEEDSVALRWKLIVYAYATWIYRFFLFLGIAALVYAFFIKLIGILLFAVEIVWFIGKPIAREIGVWFERRDEVGAGLRGRAVAFCLVAMTGLLFVPWYTRVSVPAVLEPGEHARIFAGEPGRVVSSSLYLGRRVAAGDALVVLELPELEASKRKAEERIAVLSIRTNRQAASDRDLKTIRVLAEELNQQRSVLASIEERQSRLVVRAPISGIVVELEDSLHPGRWIEEQIPLAYIANTGSPQVKGFVEEHALSGVVVGQSARFIPDDPGRVSVKGWVDLIDVARSRVMDEPHLASTHGGAIAGRMNDQKQFETEGSVYRLQSSFEEGTATPDQIVRGVLVIQGEARSLGLQMLERVLSVLIRESGF